MFANPLAIYASVPNNPVDPNLGPLWLNTTPVETLEYPFWPNLNWSNEVNEINANVYSEIPKYLWFEPFVSQPDINVTKIFSRRFIITDNDLFSARSFPETPEPPNPPPVLTESYQLIISHAADDEYTLKVLINGSPIIPSGFNTMVPAPLQWRNVKTYEFLTGPLNIGDTVDIESTVTNIGLSGSTAETNPAMFTWLMYVFQVSVSA